MNITVSEFVKNNHKLLEEFQKFWTGNQGDLSFPTEMNEADFHEQFMFFVEGKRNEQ